MTTFENATFLSYTVVDGAGRVLVSMPWAINSRIVPGGQTMTCAQDQADYIASWPHKNADAHTVHVWLGGGVELRRGARLDGVRPPDASAVCLVGAA